MPATELGARCLENHEAYILLFSRFSESISHSHVSPSTPGTFAPFESTFFGVLGCQWCSYSARNSRP